MEKHTISPNVSNEGGNVCGARLELTSRKHGNMCMRVTSRT